MEMDGPPDLELNRDLSSGSEQETRGASRDALWSCFHVGAVDVNVQQNFDVSSGASRAASLADVKESVSDPPPPGQLGFSRRHCQHQEC